MDLWNFVFVCSLTFLLGAIFIGYKKIIWFSPEKMFLLSFLCISIFVFAIEYFISGKIYLAWRELLKSFAIAFFFALGTYIGVIVNFLWQLGSVKEN